MIRSYVASAIAGAFVLGLASASIAAAKGEFDNMCAEGLALHKQIHTDCSVNGEYKGKTLFRQRAGQEGLHEGSLGQSCQGRVLLQRPLQGLSAGGLDGSALTLTSRTESTGAAV